MSESEVTQFFNNQPFNPLWLLAIFPLAWLLERLSFKSLQSFFIQKKWIVSAQWLNRHFRPAVLFLLIVTGLNIGYQFLVFPPEFARGTNHAFEILEIIAWTWLLIRCIHLSRILILSRLDINQTDNLRARKILTQFQYIERVIIIALLFLGFALILMTFDAARKIGNSLIASAGLAGIILGFAAQRSLGNLFAGLQVAFTQPIRLDDVVVVEGEWGRIEEITLTYVVVRLWDKRRLILPLTYLIEKPIQNWTRSQASLLSYSFLYFDYSLPLDPIREEFHRILKNSPLWDGDFCSVQVTDATEKSMQVRFLMSARNSSEAFDLRCEVREKILNYVRKNFLSALPQFRVETSPQV